MSELAAGYQRSDAARVALTWRAALSALFLLYGWQIFLYWDTAASLVEIWSRSDTFAHDFLVPPISLWLIWRQRFVIAKYEPRPSMIMIALLAAISFVWLLAEWGAINSLAQLAFVGILVFTVPAVLGVQVAKVIIFPLGYLFFAVPVGEFLMPQLMVWTADFTVGALRLSGIPVYREGLQMVIPSGAWSVVEACSGVRYLIASITVGTLFAYLNFKTNKRRLLFVLVSILVPVMANWVRAYFIVLLGHVSGNKLATGVDHLIYGWLFFGFVITLMFLIGARWSDAEAFEKKDTTAIFTKTENSSMSVGRLWILSISAAFVVALPQITKMEKNQALGENSVPIVLPLTLKNGWESTENEENIFKPGFKNTSTEINKNFASNSGVVGTYLGLYTNQDFRHKLISSENVLVPSHDVQWALISTTDKKIKVGDTPVSIRAFLYRNKKNSFGSEDARLLVWRVYWVNGKVTANDYMVKIYSIYNRLMGQPDAAAAVVIYTANLNDQSAHELLEIFLQSNYAIINEQLMKTQQKKLLNSVDLNQ